MAKDKIILLTHPSDQADILEDYIEWHLELGVDFIVAQDCMSSDNSHEILDRYARRGQLHWFPLPDRNMRNYNSLATLAKVAIERHAADWLIMNDVDEFLCPQGNDLRTILQRADAEDVTAISVRRFNMTGPIPGSSDRALETLTLRIDRPTTVHDLSGNLPMPNIYLEYPPKTIARASAFVEYGAGTHTVVTAQGRADEFSDLRLLHFQIRGFDTFQKKITNAVAFFEQNQHLEPWWAARWRRWIRLNEEGRLREDYESQFVSPARAEELIRDGTCSVDETISRWIKKRKNPSC